jgi:predicted anti-sigma-YlaC factor YlaD
MNCVDYQRTISRLVDLEVKAAASADLFEHLGKCAECRGFLDTLTKLNMELDKSQLLTELTETPDNAWSQTKPVVKSIPTTYVSAFVRYRISVPAPIALAVTVALLAIVLLVNVPLERKQIAAVRQAPPVQITTLPVVKLP